MVHVPGLKRPVSPRVLVVALGILALLVYVVARRPAAKVRAGPRVSVAPLAACPVQNTGLPTRFLSAGSFRSVKKGVSSRPDPLSAITSCSGALDDGLGRNVFPATLPKQLFPESKMHLVPFPEPKMAAEWQRSRIDPTSRPLPVCDDIGACECAEGKLFDGRKCIEPWGGDPYRALAQRWASAPLKVRAGRRMGCCQLMRLG